MLPSVRRLCGRVTPHRIELQRKSVKCPFRIVKKVILILRGQQNNLERKSGNPNTSLVRAVRNTPYKSVRPFFP